MSAILVIGSAHLDILARARTRDDVLDRVGDISIEVGGTAANIAINIAHAGTTARFLSALNTTAYSRVIIEYLAARGVEMHVDYLEKLPNGGFSAHINTHGEMVSAVSSMPIDRVNFDPQRITDAMVGTKAVILDCNLSSLAINRIVTLANDRRLPVYIASVSEEKCVRVADILGRVKGLFLNQKEYRFFCREVLRGEYAPAIAAKKLNTMIVLTRGAEGTTIARPGHPDIDVPAPHVDGNGSRLGMGDALAAGLVLLHEIHGLGIREAARNALKMVAWVGAQQHCHPGAFGAFETVIDKYQHHAGHDAMTGILNRHSCEQALNSVVERRHQGKSDELSVLMIDIDHFKGINDTFGHSKGDDVIVSVAQTIQGCLRETDHVGRWGGEEFLVVLPRTPREGALRVAERIRAAVESRIHEPRQVTVSVGCGVVEHGVAMDSRSLVDQADAALYSAKRSGRNRVMCASA